MNLKSFIQYSKKNIFEPKIKEKTIKILILILLHFSKKNDLQRKLFKRYILYKH